MHLLGLPEDATVEDRAVLLVGEEGSMLTALLRRIFYKKVILLGNMMNKPLGASPARVVTPAHELFSSGKSHLAVSSLKTNPSEHEGYSKASPLKHYKERIEAKKRSESEKHTCTIPEHPFRYRRSSLFLQSPAVMTPLNPGVGSIGPADSLPPRIFAL